MGLLAAVLALVLMLLLNATPMASNDLWLQMRIGQWILDHGEIPHRLLFPFTPARDAAFTAHEWLPSLLFHGLDKLGGQLALQVAQGVFACGQLGLAWLLAFRLCRSQGLALLLAIVAMVTCNYRYVLRPELLALGLFVLMLIVLVRARDEGRPRLLLWLAPLAVLWANVHGSFLLGPAVVLIFATGETIQCVWDRRRQGVSLPTELGRSLRQTAPWWLAGVAMVALSVLNPQGPALLGFAFKLNASSATEALIKEWRPTFSAEFRDSPALPVFLGVALSGVALMAWLRRSLRWTELLMMLAFGALALQRNRHIVWFAFVWLMVVASLAGRHGGLAAPGRETRARYAATLAGLVGICLAATYGNLRGAYVYESPSNNFNAGMIQELASPALQGPVLTSYELGAELIYRDWPRLQPSIDSRVDSYGDAYFLSHSRAFLDQAEMLRWLDTYGINHMLLLHREFATVKRMPAVAEAWRIRVADNKMLLLERVHPVAARVPPPLSTAADR